MRIAICEDDKEIQTFIERKTEECLKEIGLEGECECFSCAEELLEKGSMPYSFYILDIQMGRLSGMELAEYIRRQDKSTLILFVTGYKEMMQQAFDVQAFQYLVKPINPDTAYNVIMRALRTIQEKRNYICFTNKKKDTIFYYDEIECIESRRRKIIVHTEKGDYEFYGSLNQIEEDIKGPMFVRVHKSYLINLEKLREVERESVTLRSELKVPITRTYRQEFNKAYQKFVLMSKGDENR